MKLLDERNLNITKTFSFTDKETIGIVVKTAEELESSNYIGVYIPKIQYGIDFSADPKEENETISLSKIVNAENNNIGQTSITTRNYIVIMGLGIPNIGVPVFQKGEKVFIKFVDNDIKSMYYLSETLINPTKRQDGDTFRIGAVSPNMTQKNMDIETSKENFYYMDFDTKNQRIIIQNSQTNGEKHILTFLLDAKNGTISLISDKNIGVTINAENDQVTLQNGSDSLITLKEDQIDIKSKKLNIEIDESINIKTKRYSLETTNFDLKSKNSTEEHKTLSFKATKADYDINMYKIKSLSYLISVPIMEGDVTAALFKGALGATALSMSPSPPSPSSFISPPAGNSISECGNSQTKVGTQKMNTAAGAVPTVKSPNLSNVLITIASIVDTSLGLGPAVAPPTCVAAVSSQLSSLSSVSSSSA